MQYYYENNGQQNGPVSLDELKKLVSPTTNVWAQGFSGWLPANQVQELQSVFAVPPPLPGATPPPIVRATVAPPVAVVNTKEEEEKKKRGLIWWWVASAAVVVIGIVVITRIINKPINIEGNGVASTEVTNAQPQSVSTTAAVPSEPTITQADVDAAVRQKANQKQTEHNMGIRNNILKYVTTDISEHEDKSSFTINVTNSSEFKMDQVIVYVSYYLGKGNDYVDTKPFYITNLAPSMTETITVPENKGVGTGRYQEIKIFQINSNSLKLCYPLNNGDYKDPWKCSN